MKGATSRRRACAERIVLLVWRCFPRRSRERHAEGVSETLAAIHTEGRALRDDIHVPRDEGPFSSRRIVLDALLTLVRAWTEELRGSGAGPGNNEAPSGSRHGRGWRAMAESLAQDAAHSARTLQRTPGFTAVAVLTLALGIGGATAIFSLVNAVLLEPLAYPEPERLIEIGSYYVQNGLPEEGSSGNGLSYTTIEELRRRSDVLADIGGFSWGFAVLLGGTEPVYLRAGMADPQLFRTLGVPAAIGRTLQPGDIDAVVLGSALWKTHFGADPAVLGRTVRIAETPYVIIGVMPPEFLSEGLARLWVPANERTAAWATSRSFRTIARTAEGLDFAQVRASLRAAASGLAGDDAVGLAEGSRLHAVPMHARIAGDAGSVLWPILGTVGAVLLICCVNVANLQVARYSVLRRDTALRSALGASRARIVQRLLVENLLIASLGGAAGLVLAYGGLRLFLAFGPRDLPRIDEVGIDLTVLAFMVSVTLATAMLFGAAPALRASRLDIREALQRSGKDTGAGMPVLRLRNALLVTEVALAVVLLVGAALMINSFVGLLRFAPGYEPDGVLTTNIEFHFRERSPVEPFLRDLRERLQRHPGVRAVGTVSRPPLGTGDVIDAIGNRETPLGEEIDVHLRAISGGYLDALRIPLLAGRGLLATDTDRVLLSETAARRLWPDASPAEVVGRLIRFAPIQRLDTGRERQFLEVVGVVGDLRYAGLDPQPRPELYLHQARWTAGRAFLIVRTDGDPAMLATAIREAVWSIDAEQPITAMATMHDLLSDSLARPRFYALLFSAFGAVALAISAAGVFGIGSYTVARRLHEIGVRIALGARPAAVLRLVVGQGLVAVVLGLGIGLLAARWLARFVEGLLYGVQPTDPTTSAFVCALLATVAIVAIAIPARRATRIDPVRVLREE